MKKYFIIVLLLLLLVISVKADDEAFYTALESCRPYSSNGQTKTEGALASFRSQILGWENDKCIYKEQVNYSGIEACTTCRLTQRQINELVKVMRAYTTVQKYSGEEPDISSLQSVQGNPVVKVWNKYLNDSSVCTIELSK